MATNFMGKIVEIGLLTFIRRTRIPRRLEYRNANGRVTVVMIWLRRLKIW